MTDKHPEFSLCKDWFAVCVKTGRRTWKQQNLLHSWSEMFKAASSGKICLEFDQNGTFKM